MNLRQIIEYVDDIAPNAYTPKEKTLWLNELEYSIQSDVLGMTEGLTDHVWEDSWRGAGVRFPDSRTLVLPGRLDARAGGEILITGLTTMPGNNLDGLTVLSASAADGETTLVFSAGTFPETGEDAGTASVIYDGGGEAMIVPVQWEKIYYAWLKARVSEASGEYTRFANEMQLYNQFIGEYQRWYARNYIDPEE